MEAAARPSGAGPAAGAQALSRLPEESQQKHIAEEHQAGEEGHKQRETPEGHNAEVRKRLLWAAGLRDLTNVPPGAGYTGHAFNDHNHCDATTMLGEVAHNTNQVGPNQVQVYVPEASHPAHGVIRTIVKDGNFAQPPSARRRPRARWASSTCSSRRARTPS